MTALRQARCGVCTRVFACVDGTMREHRVPTLDSDRVCPGSGGPPRAVMLAVHLETVHLADFGMAIVDNRLPALERRHDELHRRGDFGAFMHDRESLERHP